MQYLAANRDWDSQLAWQECVYRKKELSHPFFATHLLPIKNSLGIAKKLWASTFSSVLRLCYPRVKSCLIYRPCCIAQKS